MFAVCNTKEWEYVARETLRTKYYKSNRCEMHALHSLLESAYMCDFRFH